MEHPSLQLTSAAKRALIAHINQIKEYRAIAAVLWFAGASSGEFGPKSEEVIRVQGAHWGVGFYDPADVPPDEVVEIDGLPFCFGQGKVSMRLDGAILDYQNGAFHVTEKAI